MRYSVLGGGKRFRPLLAIAAAIAAGGQDTPSRDSPEVDAGCAVELVHCFSLVHDDLPALDNDDMRRGRPTCHKMFGESIALLAGDALFALAFETVSRMRVEGGLRDACIRVLANAVHEMVVGQTIDVESEGKRLDSELLEYMHTKKTGALMAAACKMGAIVTGNRDVDTNLYERIGIEIGLLFQIWDDVLDAVGPSEATGKTQGSDAARNKATYVSLFGLDSARRLASIKAKEIQDQITAMGPSAWALQLMAANATDRSN